MLLQIAFGICLIILAFAVMNVGARSPATAANLRRQRRLAETTRTHQRNAHRTGSMRRLGPDLLADPQLRAALDEGRVLDAARHVRKASGVSPKEARRLVERHIAR